MLRCELCKCDKAQAWPRVLVDSTYNGRGFFFTTDKISQAIASGCRACAFLKEGIELFHHLENLKPFQSLRWYWGHFVDLRSIDNAWLVGLSTGEDTRVILEFVEPGPETTKIPEANSPETLQWIRDLLAHCSSMHTTSCHGSNPSPICSNSMSTGNLPVLPTRVIYVGSSDSTIKLLEPQEGSLGQYSCLSHCWGNHQPLRNLKHNRESLKTGIPWSDLPKTFRETIYFTRILDIDYIWIDSLCIVQDDIDDWNREAGNMASIYRNSYITLSATSSANCDSGLFHQRKSRKLCKLAYVDKNGGEQHILVRPRVRHWDDQFDSDFACET